MKTVTGSEANSIGSLAISSDVEISDSKTSSATLGSSKRRKSRPPVRRLLQFLRRGHLYLGLFLLPWALLYGVTGFLFNHPNAFSDSPVVYFDRHDMVGTELENPPPLSEFVEKLVGMLNDHNVSNEKWTVGKSPIRYSGRDTFVATVNAENRTYFFVFDPNTQSGLIRENTTKRPTETVAPFATSVLFKEERTSAEATRGKQEDLQNLESIVDRIRRAAPKILQRKGFPTGSATVTSGPDIKFSVIAADGEWNASFNPISKQVSGAKGEPTVELSWRTFLLRMHLSHRYPSEWNTKWLWALGVDAMALTLCFWGLSGLVMWWQIKATRRAGGIVLFVSLIAAITLGLSMYSVLTI